MAEITNTKAPNLTLATDLYSRSQQDQLNNQLRIYFNTLDNFSAQTKTRVDTQNVMMWLGGFGGGC
jgi:hypothetical protein